MAENQRRVLRGRIIRRQGKRPIADTLDEIASYIAASDA